MERGDSMVVVRLTLSMEGWQYALLEGLQQLKISKECETLSGALRFVMKHGWARILELAENDAWDEDTKRALLLLRDLILERRKQASQSESLDPAKNPTLRRM